MKISLNWLRSYINFSLNALELAPLLTQRGLEVAHIHPTIKGGLDGLIIGEVRSCLPHPNADRLQQTLVDIGSDRPCTIVCGAPNVEAGQKVVVAPVGSTIYNYVDQTPFQIKKVKIRGVWSEGMICSEDEIGIGPAHGGIIVLSTMLPAGTPAKDYFKDLLDEILEIEITPNRADACSHLGIARELKAILHLPTTLPSIEAFHTVRSDRPLKIDHIDPILCSRYTGLLLKHNAIQPSPEWLRARLLGIGVKPINNVVDVTNFVLHELGQPLHAFDYDTIIGQSLMVQLCPPGTLFTGLDGITRTLAGHEPMICDEAGPIAMAGIMGGYNTRITETTQHIFIESAYFHPTAIRCAAQHHHIKTDASFRFERGTDPNLPLYALKRAVLLLQELVPSVEACDVVEYYPSPLAHFNIPIAYADITRCLGKAIEPTTIKQIITDLEIAVEAETEQGFTAKVPPYRVDVTRKADLIEEIARIYGYDRIPNHLTAAYFAPESTIDKTHKVAEETSKMLVANGYYEICTNSLTKEAYTSISATKKIISILNPLSASINTLRSSLLFSGLEVIAYNLARRHHDLKLFELGTIYHQDGRSYNEEKRLALWLTGEIELVNQISQRSPITLQNVRATIEQLVQKLGIIDVSYKAVTHPFYTQGVEVVDSGKLVATFGQVHPSITNYFSLEQPVFFADICWNQLLKISRLHKIYQPISKFPAVKRDLSLIVDNGVCFQDIKDLILRKGHKNIQSIRLFDVYKGPNLPENKSAYAITFTLQDIEKTLNDKTIDQIMDQLMQTFESELHVIIRR
ncbi:phenylalanine--tRNA ligase subunit beta [Cardinium endosymbiont of Bemisia tabaci]|uniref:phenylalanine--tRNA ligase subunit beta n=1 Tax=Cardinium endosymbiont of Bemisia tabaci TaxID=672794 RepID=UPI000442D24C|nr:phenylalanine--tRNA ligase subunit beta [Cardinium endosymbiont of Bemisia tabaci]CDG49718.1 Phenylalanine--tRNA ligase beta subunit [Cardinium endosymbiont cBtQ1 of Bemisia tabaci]